MTNTLIISSFIAGFLTVLFPCVFPLLPVIIGSTAGSNNPLKPLIVTASLGLSIVFFTLLLKASTLLIDIPRSFWNSMSGGIVFLFGIFLLFPNLWISFSLKLGFEQNSQRWLEKANKKDSLLGSILIGAALGPVFSSCSPTYFIILAIVLPANFLSGVVYLTIYALGLMLILGLIAYFGQKIIMKLKWATNPNGIFKKSMGILLIILGLLVITGYTKLIETNVLNSGYNATNMEQELLDNIQFVNSNSLTQNNVTDKYQDYSPEKVEQMQTKIYRYAFFFHASWCNTCHALEKTIFDNINKLPEKSVIFKVDYDLENQLKKTLNILTQTTVVFFDEQGNVIDRKINPSFERIIQSLSGNTINNKKSYLDPIVKKSIKKLKDEKKNYRTAKEYLDFLTKEESLSQATFAGGCFWCLEAPFEAEDGVIETFNGYAGGNVVNPSYQEVSNGKTGAREAVNVFYDPRIISHEELLEIYWRQIDPTDAGGQFADRGTQYTTAIYYRDDKEKEIAQNSKKALENSGKFSQIASEIVPFESFYLAEEYHQDYYKKSADRYHSYKIRSGRERTIEKNSQTFNVIFDNSEQLYVKPSDNKVKSILDGEAYAVTQEGATEKPFNNAYWDNHAHGIYVDVVTGEPLFSSTHKFDSRTGWPSFTQPIDDNFVIEKEDNKMIVSRTEVKSKIGDSHLGHVFNDGPKDKGGMRYCINSAALRFIPLEKMEEKGYKKYVSLFNYKSENK
jgi:peptide methionine sulfoxide reductase msrA/msrB